MAISKNRLTLYNTKTIAKIDCPLHGNYVINKEAIESIASKLKRLKRIKEDFEDNLLDIKTSIINEDVINKAFKGQDL